MPAKQNSYLVQLRDQIARSFDLEELKELAFELNLDWDELHGSRKTTRIQDLITQLARNGRLEELTQLLQQKRPKEFWPDAPPPKQQKLDIRTAFPKKSYYQKAWFWGIAIFIITIIGISITTWFGSQSSNQIDQLPEKMAGAIPTDTPIPTPTITPIPSPTPLPFEPEAEDETLIILVPFEHLEGVTNVGAHEEIHRGIEKKVRELDINYVRIGIEKFAIQSLELADFIGKQYDASIVIWGKDTGIRLETGFLNRRQAIFSSAETTISETEKSQLANPKAYANFVINELPDQITFLVLFTLGQIEFTNGELTSAIELMEEAVEIVSSELDLALEEVETAHFFLAYLYQIRGDSSSAINYYNQVLVINPENIDGYNNLGVAFANVGDFEQALEAYQQGLGLLNDSNNLSRKELLLSNIGSAYLFQDKYYEALASFEEVLTIHLEAGDRRGEGKALFNIASVYNAQGRFEDALSIYEQALAISQEMDDQAGEGMVLNNIASVYYSQGRYEDALSVYEQMLAISRELGDRAGEIAALNNFASIYYSQGEYEDALSFYEQALAISQEMNDQAGEAAALLNIASVHNAQGRLEEALSFHEMSLTIAKGLDNLIAGELILDNLNSMIEISMYLGDFQNAIDISNQAINLNPEYFLTYYNRGLAFYNLGEYELAITDFYTVLELDHQIPFREDIENLIEEIEERLEN